MDSNLPRHLSRFATFFTLALPLFAALAAAALHRPFVHMIGERGAGKHWLANLYFNQFPAAIAIPVGAAALLGTLALLTLRRSNAPETETLGRIVILLCLSAMVAPAWLAGFLLAAVLG